MNSPFLPSFLFIGLVVMAGVFIVLPLAAFVATMCWNYSIHYLFGLPKASYWEMVGFLIFVGILKGIFSIKIHKD